MTAPTLPLSGTALVTTGRSPTRNGDGVVPVPNEFVTWMGPVVAPIGTVTSRREKDELTTPAGVPLKSTLIGFASRCPSNVTRSPTLPATGENKEMTGGASVTTDEHLPCSHETMSEAEVTMRSLNPFSSRSETHKPTQPVVVG